MTAADIIINEESRIPKYKQIVDSIIGDIATGKVSVGEKIPSINELSESCYLSRDTVEKAYKTLKDRKIIESVHGKGYYTTKTNLISKLNIFFLINKPSTYKMEVYDSFVDSIGINAHVNVYIYHCDQSLFINALEGALGAYDHYVIMPHFRDSNSNHVSYTDDVLRVIEKVPKEKLLILDNTKPVIKGAYSTIYQDFKNDIYDALKQALEKLRGYNKIILIYPKKSAHPYPRRILDGFLQFCREYDLDYEVLDEIYQDMELASRDVYITVQERDLVNLLRQVRAGGLALGKDMGIISYNDTPLKELLDITVISTDFRAMGASAACMLLSGRKENVKNAFNYIERSSL